MNNPFNLSGIARLRVRDGHAVQAVTKTLAAHLESNGCVITSLDEQSLAFEVDRAVVRRALDPFRQFSGGSGHIAIQLQRERLFVRFELRQPAMIFVLLPVALAMLGVVVYFQIIAGQSPSRVLGGLLVCPVLYPLSRWYVRNQFARYFESVLEALPFIDAERNVA